MRVPIITDLMYSLRLISISICDIDKSEKKDEPIQIKKSKWKYSSVRIKTSYLTFNSLILIKNKTKQFDTFHSSLAMNSRQNKF